jgi:peptide/nickel transport system substrate-binding protein
MSKRSKLLAAVAAAGLLANPAWAQTKDTIVVGMALEPPGLDPTTGAAAAIGEITLYNIFEGLTKVNADASVTPLLADSWTVTPDLKTYTFSLRRGVKFQNGEVFSSADVRYSFARAAAPDSTNKDKAFFAGISAIDTPDAATVVLHFKDPAPDAPFHLGEPAAVLVEPQSAATDAVKPIGTGPFLFDGWAKGASVTLTKWRAYRDAARVKLDKVTFRMISDPAAQVAALLSGDVDAFPRFGSFDSVAQFESDPRFQVLIGGTEGKTILAINNKRKPLDDVRVRRAIAYAIDRRSIIEGAMNGYGTPIGSHAVPGDPGYLDLTGMYPYDPAKAQASLKEAGIPLPLRLTLVLPPPSYARQGGEIIAAELGKVGIEAKIEDVEWAQWLSGVYTNKNYDLTVISHVEPLDLMIYANPNYYFQYDSQAFRDIMARANSAYDRAERLKALGDAQRKLAEDAVNAFLFQLPQVCVADKRIEGLWKDAPIFANDMAAVSWQ